MSSSEDEGAGPAQPTRTSARAKRARVLDSDESEEQDDQTADGYAFLVSGAPSEDYKQTLLASCSGVCATQRSESSEGSRHFS